MQKQWALSEIYTILHDAYGPQGWWPISSLANTPGFDARGYHRGDYLYPKTDNQRWEIVLGAILTQNTAWTNVEKAMANLRAADVISKERIIACSTKKLAALIRPAGYFNQKAERLKIVARFFLDHPDTFTLDTATMRQTLLGIKGIGPETADSIILYAAKRPLVVIDAYTRRILSRVGLTEKDAAYDRLQQRIMEKLPPDAELFNEYHALLVEHAKRYCRTTPLCAQCPLARRCRRNL